MPDLSVTRTDVEEAAERVADVIRLTPVEEVHALSKVVGRRVLLKPEHRQRTGCASGQFLQRRLQFRN